MSASSGGRPQDILGQIARDAELTQCNFIAGQMVGTCVTLLKALPKKRRKGCLTIIYRTIREIASTHPELFR